MRTSSRAALLASAAVVASGCVGADAFRSKLTVRSHEMMYIHEKPATERLPGSVSLGAYTVEQELPPETTVTRTGWYYVPLLIVNAGGVHYKATLGAAQISNDYVQFMKDSLVEELRRSAHVFKDHDGDVQIDVKVTNIEVKAPIEESNWNFCFGIGEDSIRVGPAQVTVTGELVARKSGREVLRKIIAGSSTNGTFFPDSNRTIDTLMSDYGAAIVEAFSYAVKRFNEAAVGSLGAAMAGPGGGGGDAQPAIPSG